MTSERDSSHNIIQAISSGSIGNVELDRGGHWSAAHGLWVDKSMQQYVDRINPAERPVIEALGALGLRLAAGFKEQISDTQTGIMWPQEVFGADGAGRVLEAAAKNPTVEDPYSVLSNGLDTEGLPYSHRYQQQFAPVIEQLRRLTRFETPAAGNLRPYFEALARAYAYDPSRKSDLTFMRQAEVAWVQIPSDIDILTIAIPSEVYLDPARPALSKDQRIADWDAAVTKRNGLGPWRPFIEFRALVKDALMITDAEAGAIRSTTRQLFSAGGPGVQASLEFRRLIMAAGNGAHPAKTAKNYPNFNDIRETIGYKNVLYTNMIEEGALTQILPTLVATFGGNVLNGSDLTQFIRGHVLHVVSHEENHPYKVIDSSNPLEELKATVNGAVSVMKVGIFRGDDIRAMLAATVGSAIHARIRTVEARIETDVLKERAIQTYYVGDTVMMNYMISTGGFTTDQGGNIIGIDYRNTKKVVETISADLDKVHAGETPATHYLQKYGDEKVWERLKL